MFRKGINSVLLILLALAVIFISTSCEKLKVSKLEADDFTSDFDQGNIRNVTKIGENEFNLEIDPKEEFGEDRPQWYHFKIRQNAKDQTVTFHITNARVRTSGATPRPVYSYDQTSWKRIADISASEGVLTFTHIFTEDTVWIARNFPYSYTLLQTHMDAWDDNTNVGRETLYTTSHFDGLKVELLTITDSSVPEQRKKVIWIIAREHPGEVGGCWPLKGMIDLLTSDANNAKAFLGNYIFKIVPMMNPDAVYVGKGYYSVNGINFEENWNGKDGNPEDPEIKAVHNAINAWYDSGKKIDLFLNLHTASSVDFIYCISAAESSQSYRERQIPLFGVIINSTTFRYIQEFRTAPGDAVKELFDEHKTNGILIEFAKYKAQDDPTIAIYEQQGREILRAVDAYLSGRYFTSVIPIY